MSIYEAIPELVPDGMVYDKKSNSLIDKEFLKNYDREDFCDVGFKVTEVVSKCDSCGKKDGCFVLSQLDSQPIITECADYEKTDNISSFAKKLAPNLPFNCSEIQWVVDVFGEERARNILDMLCACGLKLSDIEPLKK